MRYLFWRGRSLYCRYPIDGMPERYPLHIYRTSDAKSEIARCEREGEKAMSALRTRAIEGKYFEPKAPEPEPDPTYCVLALWYWYYRMRFQKSAQNDRWHLYHSIRKFGPRVAREIQHTEIELWMREMRRGGAEVNSVNRRFAYMRRVYRYNHTPYNPTADIRKLPGERTRQFVLTAEKFERNYRHLLTGDPEHSVDPSPDFALFYLALWETGRRPREVAEYTWDMVHELDIDGQTVRGFFVPPELTKTDEPAFLPISDRLWTAMLQAQPHAGYVFKNTMGQKWADWRWHMGKLKKRFGDDAGWARDNRRGFATHKTEVLGLDPSHVRDFGGWRTDEVFRRYRIGSIRNLAKVAGFRPNCGQIVPSEAKNREI